MEKLRITLGVLLVLIGVFLAIYLSVWVMLVGGIAQAVDSWGVDNHATVWGIVRAVLCEIGLVPGILLMAIGRALVLWDE